MQFFVTTLAGKTLPLTIDPTDFTVAALKSAIEVTHGISRTSQRILCRGRTLSDETPLNTEDRLYLIVNQ